MNAYPVCARCLQPIYPSGCTLTVDSRYICTCHQPLQITFISYMSESTPMSVTDWNKQLKAMRNWSVTLHGRLDGVREHVPDAFQDAFQDGDLEV